MRLVPKFLFVCVTAIAAAEAQPAPAPQPQQPQPQQAGEALHRYISAYRARECPSPSPDNTSSSNKNSTASKGWLLTHAESAFAAEDTRWEIEIVALDEGKIYRASCLALLPHATSATTAAAAAAAATVEVEPASVLPPPCEPDTFLLITYAQIDIANRENAAQNLSWRAAMPPHMRDRVYTLPSNAGFRPSFVLHDGALPPPARRDLTLVAQPSIILPSFDVVASATHTNLNASGSPSPSPVLQLLLLRLEPIPAPKLLFKHIQPPLLPLPLVTVTPTTTRTTHPNSTSNNISNTTSVTAVWPKADEPREGGLSLQGVPLPLDYDARDVYPDQPQCKGFQVLDQGATGACAFFATVSAFSARMCLTHGRASPLSNTLLSVQHFADCSSPDWNLYTTIAPRMLARPSPWLTEAWCTPYRAIVGACSAFCPTGRLFNGVPDTERFTYGIAKVQGEILRNGPVIARMQIPYTTTFWAYRSGVFVGTTTEPNPPYHGVSVLGWGQMDGLSYWLCQNSWGNDWGEQGFFKIAFNSLNIEAGGFASVKPAAPLQCTTSESQCSVWARVRNDCACDCNGTLRTGARCELCPPGICKNGGRVNGPDCARCLCPVGFTGAYCQHCVWHTWGSEAYCSNGAKTVAWTVKFNFNASGTLRATTEFPQGNSFVGFYTPANVAAGRPFSYAAMGLICGTNTSRRCPPTGQVSLSLPKTPGRYVIYQINAFTGGSYAPDSWYNTLIGYYTVLLNSTACTPTLLAQAVAAYGPTQLLDAEAARTAQREATMLPRLATNAVARAAVALWDDSPTLTITNIYNVSDPVDIMWQGAAPDMYSLCYKSSPLLSAHTKWAALFFFPTDTWLIDAVLHNQSLIQGAPHMVGGPCFSVRLKAGMSFYSNAFTLRLTDSQTSATLVDTKPFRLARAFLTFSTGVAYGLYIDYNLNLNYRDRHPAAGVLDIARIFERKNPTVPINWCYVYCAAAAGCCRTRPILTTTTPKALGVNHLFRVRLPRSPTGTAASLVYSIKVYPGDQYGGSVVEYTTLAI